MQVILDSSFALPGSAPIWGGKKVEFRDWTKLGDIEGSRKQTHRTPWGQLLGVLFPGGGVLPGVAHFRDFWDKKILVSRDLKIGRFAG